MIPPVFAELIAAVREMLGPEPTPTLRGSLNRLRDALKAAQEWDEPRVIRFDGHTFLGTGRNSSGERILAIRQGLIGPTTEDGQFPFTDAETRMPMAEIGAEGIVFILTPDVVLGLMQVLGNMAMRDMFESMETRQ